MIKFSQEKLLLLHQLISQETGGDAGVRDYGLLETAYQTYWNLSVPELTATFPDVLSPN